MTLILNVSGVSSARPVGFIPPVTRALRGYWRLGGAKDQSARNRWRGAVESSAIIGEPVLAPAFASFVGLSAYLDTGLAEPDELTVYAVCRTAATLNTQSQRPALLGNFGPDPSQMGGNIGVALYMSSAAGLPAGALFNSMTVFNPINGTPSVSGGPSLVLPDVTAWRFLALKLRANNDRMSRDLTGSLISPIAGSPNARLKNATVKLRAGSFGASTHTGPIDMAFLAIHDAWMTDEEDVAVYALERRRLTAAGIAI